MPGTALAAALAAAFAVPAHSNPRCQVLERHLAYLEMSQGASPSHAWMTYAAPDALKFGTPPKPATDKRRARRFPSGGGLRIPMANEAVLVGGGGELGVVISRWNEKSRLSSDGSEGFGITVWYRHGDPELRVMADGWFAAPDDRAFKADMRGCSTRNNIFDVFDTPATATRPGKPHREAENELIASATCRDLWPTLIEASNDGTQFLIADVAMIEGAEALGRRQALLPQVTARWRRLHQWTDRNEQLAVSAGRLEDCDAPELRADRGFIAVWESPRGSRTRSLRAFALLPVTE